MPRYLTLIKFTDQGLTAIDKTTQRAAAFRQSVEAAGGQMESQYWALGRFDGTAIFSVPSDEDAAAVLVALAKLGNVHTQTEQLFDAAEFGRIVEKANKPARRARR